RGELNDFAGLFGGWDVPLVQPGGQSRLAADAPNRVLAWGTFNLPRSIVVSPVVDWHDGFPYSNVDSRYFYAGTPNTEGFPRFVSMDLIVYKTFHAKGRAADAGFQLFNAPNHTTRATCTRSSATRGEGRSPTASVQSCVATS